MKSFNIVFNVTIMLALLAPPRTHAQVEGDPQENDFFGHCVATGDFDGDGKDDLAIGVDGESISGVEDVGAVNVLYGSAPNGITSTGDQFWNQSIANVEGSPELGDEFGFSLAVGDFDGDGYDDLAIGVPFEDVGSAENAGAVNILYGSAAGLTASGDQIWDQNSTNVEGTSEDFDEFGFSLTSGDFDGDGYDDLAIGVPNETIGSVGAGGVNILYGSSAGLTATGDQFWDQNKPNVEGACESGDEFGYSLASGDFDGDGFDDLAIGVMEESIGTVEDAGGVNVLYGSSGVGLTATGDQFWDQNKSGVEGACEEFDWFGNALASGDFDHDGYDDLAIGVWREDIGTESDAGGVNVLYGSAGVGLSSTGDQFWDQDKSGVEGGVEPFDNFGSSLTSGDFDGDGYDDLAIGVESEAVGTTSNAGAVNVLYGSAGTGLTSSGDQIWDQDKTNVEGVAEDDDEFGSSVAAGDFDGDGKDDLAIGVHLEDVDAIDNAGAVNVLYGSLIVGLTATGDQIWDQGSSLVEGDDAPSEATRVDATETSTATVLHNAYPNPFTTSATLSYDVAESGQVRLTVYDFLGREVTVLVDGVVEAGHYTAVLNGVDLPSGIYLVRLTTERGFDQTFRVTRAK